MTTAVKTQSPSGVLNQTIIVIFAVLAIVILWGANPFTPMTLVLASIIILVFMGLERPVFAVGALIIQQLTATGYMITTPFGFDISLRLLLLIFVGLVIWRSSRQTRFDLGPRALIVLLPAITLLILSLISNLINSGFDTAFKDFRDIITGLMILSFIPFAIGDISDLKIFCGITFVGITASALIGVMQHFNLLDMQSYTLIAKWVSYAGAGFRVPGMSETELELSYILSSGFLILTGVLLFKGLSPGIRRFIPVSMLIIAAATYFTYTRSAVIAIIIGLISLFLFIKTRIKGEVILVVMLIIAGFLVISPLGNQYLAGRSANNQEDSTVSRQILWQAGLGMALDHPIIGIGSDNFQSESPYYRSNVDPALLAYEKQQYWGYSTLGSVPPHNDFLNIWVSYGTPALIIFIALFILFMHNFINSFQISANGFIKGLSIGLAAALIAYGVNAFYHNALAAISLFWILGGLSVTVTKLAIQRKIC
jgi:O-antigen ligase